MATWWPSIAGGYERLLRSVSSIVADDGADPESLLSDAYASGVSFRDLDRYFFNDGVKRGEDLVERGVFEMLMRVDGVERGGSDEPSVVYGSPLWVARLHRAVPGTYVVQDLPNDPGLAVVAEWDGVRWSDMRHRDWRDPRKPRGRLPSLPEQLPEGPPDLQQLWTLSTRQERASEQDVVEIQKMDTAEGHVSWIQRIFRAFRA